MALLLIAISVGSAQGDLNGSGWWSSANVQRIGNQAGGQHHGWVAGVGATATALAACALC